MQPDERMEDLNAPEQDELAAHIAKADALTTEAKNLCEKRNNLLAKYGVTEDELNMHAMRRGVAALGAIVRHEEHMAEKKRAHRGNKPKRKKTKLAI